MTLIRISLASILLHLCVGLPAQAESTVTKPATLMVDGREAEPIKVTTAQGTFDLTAELALTTEQRATGLMHRETMPIKHGMLFDFQRPQLVTMWMQNTPLSLDMIFLTRNGKVTHIAENTTPFSTKVISSQGNVSAVLEVNAGVSKLIGLKVGDTIEHRIFKK